MNRWIKNLIASITLALFCPSSAWSQVSVQMLDFGDAQDPTFGVPLPGDGASFFWTLKNNSNQIITNIVISPSPGQCLSDLSGNIEIERLRPQESLRASNSSQVQMSENCNIGDRATLQVRGAYDRPDGSRHPIQLQSQFLVGQGFYFPFDQHWQNIGLAIPDLTTVEYRMAVPNALQIQNVGIALNINHTFVQDMRITLIHPSGQAVILHNQSGGGNDNLIVHYGFGGSTSPAEPLSRFNTLMANGEWMLRIEDLIGGDFGTLNSVRLILR